MVETALHGLCLLSPFLKKGAALDKTRSDQGVISLHDNTVKIGDTEIPADRIRDVSLSFKASRGFWILASFSLAAFATVILFMVGVSFIEAFSSSASSISVGGVFWVGMGLCIVSFVLAMVFCYPEWRVLISTGRESHVVYVSKNRTASSIYARRLREQLANKLPN